jgi:predicted DCC family thiol-disulfide oxidoreductase YuxK
MRGASSAVKASAAAPSPVSGDARPCTFYYDGDCGFCTRTVKALAALDLRRRVRWVAFQSLDEMPGGLSDADLRREAFIQRGERLEGGFYSFRRLTLALPPLWPLTTLLWLPGVNRLGEIAYAWVARNRTRLPGSVCSID